MNLLRETRRELNDNGKSLSDVIWVGCEKFEIPMEEFLKYADQEYNDGFGSPSVAQDLIVVGADFWLERHEYDGSEWWEFKTLPARPEKVRHITRLMSGAWDSIESLNPEGGE